MNNDEHEINLIESDEERITVIPQNFQHFSRDNCISPIPGDSIDTIVDEFGVTTTLPRNKILEEEKRKYISEFEVNGRIMKFNTAPLKLKRDDGIFKIIEFILILVALVLSSMVMGVSGERGFAMLVCFFAIMLIFGIVLAKVFTLDQIMDAKIWGLIELSIYIGIGVAFFIATLLMAILCTLHWAENNPEWQYFPAFASLALAFCGMTFFAEACLVFYHRRYRSWTPQNEKPNF